MSRELCKDFMDAVVKNVDLGYLEEDGNGYRLTRKGLDFANLVFMDFV